MDSLHYWFFNTRFLGIDVTNWAKFLGFILAGLILGKLLRFSLTFWINRITPKDDNITSTRIAGKVQRITFFLVFALVLNMGAIDVLHLPGWLWLRVKHLPVVLLEVAATLLSMQFVDIALLSLRKRWEDVRGNVDEILINFIGKGMKIFIVVIAVLITAQKMDIPVTGAIAGLGVGGAAFALAAQGLIANLLGTVEIVADKLYHVGDRIQFDQFDGFVVEVGLRSTKIRALSGEQIIVPNRKMAEVQIRNFSREGAVRTVASVSIVYSNTHDHIRKAMQILDEIFKARKDVSSYQIYFKNLGAYSLDLEIIFWANYATSSEYNQIMGEVNMEIKRRFDAEGIEFAFPTQTLQITRSRSSQESAPAKQL